MRPEVNTPMSRERCATAGGARRVEGETVGLRFSHLDGPTLLGDDSESGARPRIVGRAGEERERVSAPLRADVPQLLALEGCGSRLPGLPLARFRCGPWARRKGITAWCSAWVITSPPPTGSALPGSCSWPCCRTTVRPAMVRTTDRARSTR